MTTEVKHGPNPTFEHQITGVEYSLTLVGHYTTTEGWTAAGVTAFKYESDRDIKRRAELLGMRTIFLDWWVKEWIRLGGDYQEGVAQLVRYPFRPPT
jgi:hypothetical protein